MNGSARALWLALMVIFALLVGIAAALLAWAGGDNPFAAALTGATFRGTLLLLLAVLHFATANSHAER